MDTFPLVAGTTLALEVQLRDALGQPVTSYSAAVPLTATVWPGGTRAASFVADVGWIDATAGTITLIIPAAATLTLAAGRYRGELVAVDPALGPQVVYQWAIDLQAAPGAAAEPPAYCTYADMLRHARSWLPTLQGDEDEAGFAEQRGRARSWLDDLILARAGNRGWWDTPGTPGYSPFNRLAWGGRDTPNVYLRSLLDANCLVPRGWVIEATAKKALSLICEGQIGPTEAGAEFRRLGNRYGAEALALACSSTAEIAYPGPGITAGGINVVGSPPTAFGEILPMFSVNLGAGSVR